MSNKNDENTYKLSRIIYNEEQISKRVSEVGRQITKDYSDKVDDGIVVISILKGAAIFMADLVRNINLDIEIDFIISNNSKLKYKMYPIEVKSGKKYTTTSLNRFSEKYKSRIGESYIIHPKNLSIKERIVCIPAYMTFCL